MGGLVWVLEKVSPLRGCLGAGALVMAPSCWNSISTWMVISDTGLEFGVILCGAGTWTS